MWQISRLALTKFTNMTFNILLVLHTIAILLEQAMSLGYDRTWNDDPFDWKQGFRSEGQPTFRPTARNITVGSGERAILTCRVDNLGTRTITWKKSGISYPLTIGTSKFAPDPRIRVDFDERLKEWTLTIDDVSSEDEGLYHCQLSVRDHSDDGADSYDIQLNVRTVLVSGTNYVEVGRPIRLLCNATGKPDPPHNVEWYHDGALLQSDGRPGGVTVSKRIDARVLLSWLVLAESRPNHSGDYACLSSDGDSASMAVHVIQDFLMNRRSYDKGNPISAERITSGKSSALRQSSSNLLHLISANLCILLFLRQFTCYNYLSI